eukprot:1376494-Amorphochlora_amoeboformis.AAC.2
MFTSGKYKEFCRGKGTGVGKNAWIVDVSLGNLEFSELFHLFWLRQLDKVRFWGCRELMNSIVGTDSDVGRVG